MEKIKRNPIVEKLGFNRIVLGCVLILMYVLFSLLSENFAGLPRILSALNYAYFLGFLSLGVTFVIATGGIDFSIGPVMFCSALVAGYCLTSYGVTESYDLPEGVYEKEILPIAPLLHGVKEAFADPDTGMAPTIMEIDPAQIDDYYSVCETRIASLMAMEQPDSPAVQRKAVEMYRRVEKPFAVYPGMSSTILDYQNIMGFLVLLFCVVIAAPVFSADYQSGADDILRCTRNGRARLGIAKVLTALFVSAAAFVICAVVHILVVNSLFGWECTKTSIQMLYSIVTLTGMNIGELQRLFAVAGLLSVLASVSFTLFLSSKCRSIVASLASGLVFCIAPVVLSMTVPGALSTWLCSILPASGTSIQASILYAITDFKFLSLGGLAVWTPYAMIGACIIEIPLFVFLAVRSYCRHTVN